MTRRGMLAEGEQAEAFEFLLAALAAVLHKSRELELLLAEQLGTEGEEATAALDPEAEAEAREDAELEREIEAHGREGSREEDPRGEARSGLAHARRTSSGA